MKKTIKGWMRFGSCVAAGMLALGAAHAETGVTNIVNGVTTNASGHYYVGNTGPLNWLVVTNAGVLNVASNGFVGFSTGASNNTAVVTGTGSVWTNGGALNIGYGTNANNNRLNIKNGALVSSFDGIIGLDGANSSVLIADSNSQWKLNYGGTPRNFIVGDRTSGNQVTVTNGGVLQTDQGFTRIIGKSSAANSNTILVTGGGSKVDSLHDGTPTYIGMSGSGNSVVVRDGGSATRIGQVAVGQNSTANNNAIVVEGGMAGSVGEFYIGYDGSGNRLTITDGGNYTNSTAGVSSPQMHIGYNAGSSNNSVTVTGPGSKLAVSSYSAGNRMWVGESGSSNSLTVTAGGQVVVANWGPTNKCLFSIGKNAGANNNAVAVTGSNSLLVVGGALYVGESGSGNSLTIGNGGVVSNVLGRYIGFTNNSANNAVTITGAGSRWSNTNSLYVGYGVGASGNRLTLTDGTQFTNLPALYIGYGSGASNSQVTVSGGSLLQIAGAGVDVGNGGGGNILLVTGSNSVWNNGGALTLGSGGNQFTVSNGGGVSNASTSVGNGGGNNILLVTDSNSVWKSAGDMVIGNGTAGSMLTISNGAQVVAGGKNVIGTGFGANNNSVTVTGSGSVWTNASDLNVGASGNNNSLTISDGAVVANAGIGYTSYGGGSGNSVLVTGSNSTWNVGSWLELGGNNDQLTLSGTGAVVRVSSDMIIYGQGYQLTVSNGGQLFDTNFRAQNDSARILVTGSGSVWTNSGTFAFRKAYSDNQLAIAQGGVVFNGSATIGGNSTLNFNNYVTVTDPGSQWNIAGDLTVSGAHDQGVTASNGGALAVSGNMNIGTNGDQRIALTVAGGSLIATNAGAGVLNLNSAALKLYGGTVAVNGLIATNAASALAVEFGGSGPDSVLTISGTAQVGGTLSVTNPPGFTPALSNAYTILKAASVTGQFAATNLTSLGGGMRWSVIYSSTSVVAQAISDTATPTVTTDPVSNVTHSAAQCGGTVTTVEGGSPITARGVCWNLGGDPTIADSHTTDGSGTGSFASQITGLTPSQTYHVRAYATSAAGTGYGADRTCTTLVAPPGNTLSFNGTNQSVIIPDANSLDLTSNYTLECWFKADSFGSGGGALNLRGLIGKYQTTGANGYFLRMNLRELDFDQMVTSGLNLESNRWYHVAAVNSNGTRRLYVNGVEKALTGIAITVVANTDEVRLGSDYRGRYFAGQMDEVRIWSAARTQTDVQDAMHKPLAGSESGLVAYYQFNANSGTALADLTANANTGSLSNSPAWAASTFPSANLITDRINLRGAWLAQTNSLASSRLTVTNAVVTGANFAVFGHDNGADAWQTADVPEGMRMRLSRGWKMELGGGVNGTIKFDTTGLGIADPASLRMLIGSDASFANAAFLSGSYSAPYFTLAAQTLQHGFYYTLAVNGKVGSATTITSHMPDPSAYGQSITVGFSVSPSGTPTGTVTVSDGVVSATAALAAGSCTLTPVNGGIRTLTATYSGDANFNGSVSPGVSHTVQNPFTDSGVSLPNLGKACAAWGDFDNDGDLDLSFAGSSETSSYTGGLYRCNSDNTFSQINAGLPGALSGAMAWGDYNNDGFVDLAFSGVAAGNVKFTRIYRNNGNGTFTDLNAGLKPLYRGALAWADYNGDGLPDLLAAGYDGSRGATFLYRNNGDGTFTDIRAGLPGTCAMVTSIGCGLLAWGDCDNDGDPDLALTGNGVTRVFRNNSDDTFTDIAAGLPGLTEASLAWGDYDNDGHLDLLLAGNAGGSALSRVYRNNGDNTFSDSGAGLLGLKWCAVAWGDYDNDGRPDCALTGLDIATGTDTTRIYRNNGDNTFSDISAGLTGLEAGHLSWCDYDRDGRLDLLVNGRVDQDDFDLHTILYRNLVSSASNTPPAAPSALAASVDSRGIATLTWTANADGQTPADGLSYNLRLGGSAGTNNLRAGEADLASGQRRVALLGPISAGRTVTLALPPGNTYHWAVQAVDGALAGGAWSADASFAVSNYPAVATAPATNITATGATAGGEVTAQGDAPVTVRGVVWNSAGLPTVASHDGITSDGTGPGSFTSVLAGLTAGQPCYLRAYASGALGTVYGEQRIFTPRDPAAAMTPPGNALACTGAVQYVAVTNSAELNLSSAHTLEGWFKPSAVAGYQGLLSKNQTSGANGWYLRLNGTEVQFDGLSTSGLGLAANLWHHLAGIYDGSNYTIYVNGSPVLTSTNGVFNVNADPVRIGSDLGGSHFAGRMDEVRVWSVARTARELRERMHLVLDGTESGLVACYDFDQPAGLALPSRAQAAASHDGALTGFAGTEWAASTIPAGSGSANTQTEATGPVTFSGTSLAMNFSAGGVADITVSRVNAGPPNLAPPNIELFSPWWAVGRFGSGSFSANLTATVSQGLEAADEADPARVGLYRRDLNSDGGWTLVTNASSVTVASQTAVFNAVTNFGQLAVGRVLMERQATTLPVMGSEKIGPLAWGDYNNDGRLDLAIVASPEGAIKILRNDGNGAFTDIGVSIPFVDRGNVVWGDYDNDGYLDLAFIERYNTCIYRNNGDNTFTQTATLGVANGTSIPGSMVAWGDYNNDGRPDLLVANSAGRMALFRNDGGGLFTEVSAGLPVPGSAPRFAWGDYDNDGWLDFVLSDVNGAGIYRNNGAGAFTRISVTLPSVWWNNLAWGDYDNDGYLDLALIGDTDDGTRVYRNNGPDGLGNYTFSDINAGLPGLFDFASVTWGDYDNDGRLDLLIGSGTTSGSGSQTAKIFRNNGDNTFTDVSGNLRIGTRVTVYTTWGDYDSDGRLDVILGQSDATYLYRNLSVIRNTAPAAPGGLSATVTGGVATLSWNASGDSQTPAAGLTYNLRIGTASGKDDIMSAMANTASGFRKVAALGNVNMNRSWSITLPASGTYTWSVQAVDTALAGGAWGAEASFRFTLDADGDTLPNEWEATYYGGSTNANPDALASNGVNTVREAYIADLNPTNAASFFRITDISHSPTTTVSFVASAGRAYTLIGVTNLSSSAWLPVPGAGPRLGTGGADSLSDTNQPPKGPFYKLRVELP